MKGKLRGEAPRRPAPAPPKLFTGSYFPAFGLQPALGRLLASADNEPGADKMITAIRHRFWRDRFVGSPTA